MNRVHHWICGSGWWRSQLAKDLMPWALDGLALGEWSLELGLGPGLTSALLQSMTGTLVCAEYDRGLAGRLRSRVPNGNVRVLCGDATALPLHSGAFDSVLAFTMLHHVTPASAQDALFAEVARVLRPGGVFAGTDSLESPLFRMLHWKDALQIVRPDGLAERLRRAGFAETEIEVRKRDFRFCTRRGAVP